MKQGGTRVPQGCRRMGGHLRRVWETVESPGGRERGSIMGGRGNRAVTKKKTNFEEQRVTRK